ncbi:DOMON domain [Sergentomyia squamirostris]
MSKGVVLVLMTIVCGMVHGANWDHAVDFDENFRLLWNVRGQEITMEVQARTRGYIGVGFSEDGTLTGADMAIGWVDQGQPFFQVASQQATIFIVGIFIVTVTPRWKLRNVCLGIPRIDPNAKIKFSSTLRCD